MATGTGKTRTAIGLVYRLIKAARFRRVLFLVDREALGEQTKNALEDVRIENLQTFAEIYDVKGLADLRPDASTKLHIATIQGMTRRVLGEGGSVPSVDQYDCIVVDECHRGYSLDQEMSDVEHTFRTADEYLSKYRRVLDHFDAVKIGLTATPAKHTTEIFGKPVYLYSYREAVIDGCLVDHEPPIRIVTALAQSGIVWSKGDQLHLFDPRTAAERLVQTPDEVKIDVAGFNKKVITENFNKVVCAELAREIDPTLPAKTIIFCATDAHASIVVRLLKEAFAAHYGEVDNDAVVKITAGKDVDDPMGLIRRFKNERLPSVAVTVDLLTTCIDVPKVSNIVFLRRVASRILYEQMLGRATRLCPDIVAKIDALTARSRRAKEALDAIPTLLENFRQSVLASAFRGDLTAAWREKNPDVEPADKLLQRIRVQRRLRWETSELAKMLAKGKKPGDDRWKEKYEEPAGVDAEGLPELPEGWCWAGLSELADIQLGQQRAPVHAAAEVTLPYVRAANITWQGLDLTDIKHMGFPDPERYRLAPGDVLLNEASGSPSEVGKPAIWRGELADCYYQKTLLRIRPHSAEVASEWLHLSFMRDALFGKFAAMAPGVGIVHLTADRMTNWPVPLPPREEQGKLAHAVQEHFNRMRALDKSVTEMLAESKQLDASILAKAFRGDLVSQDPNDEPASVLLDRLRAERAQADASAGGANGKKRKKA